MSSAMRANFPLGNQNPKCMRGTRRYDNTVLTLIKIVLREIPSARCGGDASSSEFHPRNTGEEPPNVCVDTLTTTVL